MRVVWDFEKAKSNYAKHGIHLADAEVALFDPFALTREDVRADGERRFVTIGMDAAGIIVVTIFSSRSDEIRLISSRKATKGGKSAICGKSTILVMQSRAR
jgi:uncharacterized DUF497 family protein